MICFEDRRNVVPFVSAGEIDRAEMDELHAGDSGGRVGKPGA